MKRPRVKKPHLFRPSDAYRVIKSLRGDLINGRFVDKTTSYYVAIIWELFQQICYTSFLPTQAYGYYRSIIAYALRYDPDYLASKFIFALIRDPPGIKGIQNLSNLVEFILRR